jgi:hypothetical protein
MTLHRDHGPGGESVRPTYCSPPIFSIMRISTAEAERLAAMEREHLKRMQDPEYEARMVAAMQTVREW